MKKGKNFAQVESGKWLGKVFAPVNGTMIEANQELETSATLINEDCYGAGWMYKIQPDDMAEMEDLLHEQEAVEKWLKADIEKYAKD